MLWITPRRLTHAALPPPATGTLCRPSRVAYLFEKTYDPSTRPVTCKTCLRALAARAKEKTR